MARVVIDIPDKDRRDIYWTNGKRVANLIGEYKVLAVLPEGHGDLISRLELKKAFEHLASDDYNDPLWYESTVFRVIDNAPTVFSCNACKNMGNERECVDCHEYSNFVQYKERPHGEWIRKCNENRVDICCTNCGYDDGYSCFNFCPNCGADMRKGEKE